MEPNSVFFNINNNTLLIIPGTLHFVPPRLYSPHYWYTHTIPYSDRFCDMYIFYNCPQSKALEQLLIERGPTRDDILTWVKNKVKINCVKRGRYKFSSQIVKWFLYLWCDMIHKNTKSPYKYGLFTWAGNGTWTHDLRITNASLYRLS